MKTFDLRKYLKDNPLLKESCGEKRIDEISSDLAQAAADKALVKGRVKQSDRLDFGAYERRKDELNIDSILSMYVLPKKEYILLANAGRPEFSLRIYKNGKIVYAERNVQYGGGAPSQNGFPLPDEWKLNGPRAKAIARAAVRWIERYMDKDVHGYEDMLDWHNWVRL